MKAATVLLALSIAATAHAAEPPDPALLGAWAFEVPTPAGVTHGRFILSRESAGVIGGALSTDQGDLVMRIREASQDGQRLRVVVGSPRGDVVFTADLTADRQAFEGEVTYHTGQRFPMRGRKSG